MQVNQAIVEYNNGAKYLYNGVDFSALYDLFIVRLILSVSGLLTILKTDSVQCVKL